jgi:CheY-like chemotaxis protein
VESVSDTGVTSVLIVDDAAFSRRMLRKYVEAEGYKVLEATNGQEALDMVLECQPNCILTDLLMPDVDGFQFLEALNDKGLAIPTLIISADIQESARERGKELGAAGFINKPVKEAEIRQVVRQLLQQ